MRLAASATGSGPRTAILVHGIMSDSSAWSGIVPRLTAQGFRVVAVDLAGHGASPRAARYSPESWAGDVVETVTPLLDEAPDLVMGHSLGALVASIVAERLAPRAVVYVDPAFGFPRGLKGIAFKCSFALMPPLRRADLRRLNPKWSDADLDLEAAAQRRWHRRTMLGLADRRSLVPPRSVVAPSLVILAERSLLVTRAVAMRLVRSGMRVVRVPGAGHTVWRDEPARFAAVLEGWLASPRVAR